MGSNTGSLEVAPVMEGLPEDVTVQKRQSEQRQDGSIRAVFKGILGLIQDKWKLLWHLAQLKPDFLLLDR